MVEPPQAPLIWDSERAYERTSEAVRYLATRYPECAGSLALDSQRVAVYEAALAEDMFAFEEALRALMRAGRAEAIEIGGST